MPARTREFNLIALYCSEICSMKELAGGVEWCDQKAHSRQLHSMGQWARFHHWCLKRKVRVFFLVGTRSQYNAL